MADFSDAYMSEAESVMSEEDFFDDEENLPSPQKKTKAKTSMDVEVLGENRNKDAAKPVAKGNGKKKTVEEMYQKKTQLEHILLRPDTYSKFSRIPGTPGAFVSRIVLERIAVSNIPVSLSLSLPLKPFSSSSFSRIGGTFDAAHVRVGYQQPYYRARDYIHTRSVQDL
jgi:hypothetical protein